MRSTITEVDAWTILDSRGRPTLRARVWCEDGISATGDAPAGASRGSREAAELRDGEAAWGGLGVERAVTAVRGELRAAVRGLDARDQARIDRTLRDTDGTPDLGRLGGNAIVALSTAVARCGAQALALPLYRHLALRPMTEFPIPLMNVLNGGAHAPGGLRIQECMLVPRGASTVAERVRWGAEVYGILRQLMTDDGLSTGLGDEGGFIFSRGGVDEALTMLTRAVELAGYRPGTDIAIGIDAAANGFYRNGMYEPEPGCVVDAAGLVDWWSGVVQRHPIVVLEDPMAEDDDIGWRLVTERLGERLCIVGDDAFVTDAATIERAAERGLANAALIKPNQAGTISDALAAVRAAYRCGYDVVVSHRSGETGDTVISDLAWAVAARYLKAGAPARAERTEKYNRLMEIERECSG